VSRSFALVVVLALLVPSFAVAKKPIKRKELLLDALGEELAAKGEYTDEMYIVIRKASGCLDSDRNWEREQERPGDNTPITQIYEMLASSVVCWQGAEKKAQKAGETLEPATAWISARARYIEGYREFINGIHAKLEGDRVRTCKRLFTARDLSEAAVGAAAGLADKFETPAGQAMGAQMDTEAKALKGMVLSEIEHQKCK